MKRNWWKWLSVLLITSALAGGLLLPLKTGITAVRRQDGKGVSLPSATSTKLEADIYNFGDHFTVQQVLIKNGNSVFEATDVQWNPEGTITCTFTPVLGKEGKAESLYNLYVNGDGKWMAFPAAVSVVKSMSDTGMAPVTTVKIAESEADPDKLKGLPNRTLLYESIRNLFFHVPMWFSMIFVLSLAAWYSIKYLSKGNIDYDLRTDSLIRVAILAGALGCITGSFWARGTWGPWWPRDPKLNGVAIGMIMYLAFLLLRAGIRDEHQKARVSAVYNLFVFPVFIALIIIMPKISGDSLHPGAGGTVGFNQYDLDNTMRMFFYPSVAGWVMLFTWMGSLLYRAKKLDYQQTEDSTS